MSANPHPPDAFEEELVQQDTAGTVLKFMVLGFVVLIVCGLILFLVFRPDLSQSVKKKTEAASREFGDFESLMKAGTPEQMMKFSEGLQFGVSEQSLPVRMERLEQRVTIADHLLAEADDPVARQFATISKIESLSLIQEANLEYDLPNQNVRQSLIELTTEGLTNEDDQIRYMSHLGLVVLYINDYIYDPARYPVCQRQLEESAPALTEDLQYATKLFKIIDLLDSQGRSVENENLKQMVADALLASDTAEIRELGESGNDLIIHQRYNFSNLINELEYANEQWYQRAEGFLSAIESSDALPANTYSKAIVLIECLIRIDERALADSYRERLATAAAGIDSAEKRESVEQALEDHRSRLAMIGRDLPIQGTDVLDNEVRAADYLGRVTAILFYTDTPGRSSAYIAALGELQYLYASGARFVCIGINQQDPKKVVPLASRFDRMTWMLADDAPSISAAFPITFAPYVVIVGKDGKLAKINVGIDSLRPMLESELEAEN